MYLILHTMTILESDCEIRADFLHITKSSTPTFEDLRLVSRRLSMRFPLTNRNKLHTSVPNLRILMKNKSSRIKHQVRTIHVRNNNQTRSNNHLQTQIEDNNLVKTNPQELSPVPSNDSTYSAVNTNVYNTVGEPLMSGSIPQMTTHWLTMNRFEKHLATFANFSGADMLRMSRDDLIQICGHADGIRLYNALHSKTIDPKLTIYVCRENTSVFNAIFLSAHNNIELLQKLALFTCIPQEQVRDIYMQGPQSIHVHLSNDVIKHIKDETMFSLEVVQDNSSYIFILKPMAK